MRGYAYDRRDVTGAGWPTPTPRPSARSSPAGGEKPYEVELFVAEVGDARRRRPDLPPHLRRPGRRRARLRRDGRAADVVAGHLRRALRHRAPPLDDALRLAVAALGHSESERPRDPGQRPRGRRARPHPHPAPQVPAALRAARLGELLGARARSSTAGRAVRGGRASPARRRGTPGRTTRATRPTRSRAPTPPARGPGHRGAGLDADRASSGSSRRATGGPARRRADRPGRSGGAGSAAGSRTPPPGEPGQV